MRIIVKSPARLHLGLLDNNGELGRIYGSIGVAIEHPTVELEAEPAGSVIVEGLEVERVRALAYRFLDRFPCSQGVRLTLKASIPSHVGLGSGTQLALAVGTALARLGNRKLPVTEIAAALGRGVHSGIGIATFQHGGFVLDGGHRLVRSDQTVFTGVGQLLTMAELGQVPPILFRHTVPADWYFVTIVPEADPGFSGEREQYAFQNLPPAPAAYVEKISRLLLMKMLPALVEEDIFYFGQALTEIQLLVGESFAAVQGGRFARTISEQLTGYLLDQGAFGAGQSSWGPAVYVLAQGAEQAARLEDEAQQFLASRGRGRTYCVHADNQGARIESVPEIGS